MKRILILLCLASNALHAGFLCRSTPAQKLHEKTDAMWEAIFKDDLTTFKKLFLKEPYPLLTAKREGSSPFVVASRTQEKAIALWMLESKKIFNLSKGDLSNALLTVRDDRNFYFVKHLIDKGANVNVQDVHGMTPLIYSVVCGQTSLVDLYLRSGADKTFKSSDGKTAYEYIFREGGSNNDPVIWHLFDENGKQENDQLQQLRQLIQPQVEIKEAEQKVELENINNINCPV